jgi:hypothetical protein
LPIDNGRGFYDVALQPDGKIVAVGNWSEIIQFNPYLYGLLMRFLPNGTVDSTFGVAGKALLAMDNCLPSFQQFWFSPDQKITVLGSCYNQVNNKKELFFARFNNDISNSVQKIIRADAFLIYPNPAADVIFIQCTDENPRPQARLRLLDARGKVVFEKTEISHLESVQTAGFPSGVYILEIVEGGSRFWDKIWIIH